MCFFLLMSFALVLLLISSMCTLVVKFMSFPCCVILLVFNTSLLCTFVDCQHFVVVHSWCSLTFSCCVTHSCCLLTSPCCVADFYYLLAPHCCVLLVLVGTLLLCAFVVHWHLVVVCFCCSLAPCCYVFLLIVGASLLCIIIVCWCFLAMHSWCS